MNKAAGWHVWIDDGGCIRMFTVCNPDLGEAESLALPCVGGGTTISLQEVTQELISKLCIQPDRVVEWGSLGLREPRERLARRLGRLELHLTYRGYSIAISRDRSVWRVYVSPKTSDLPILHRHSLTVSESENEALAEAKRQIDLLLSSYSQQR